MIFSNHKMTSARLEPQRHITQPVVFTTRALDRCLKNISTYTPYFFSISDNENSGILEPQNDFSTTSTTMAIAQPVVFTTRPLDRCLKNISTYAPYFFSISDNKNSGIFEPQILEVQ